MNHLATERQLSWLDHVRLFNLLTVPRAGLNVPAEAAEQALDLLDMAELVDPEAIAPNVVTMRSRVRLQRPRGDSFEVTLVYPAQADAADSSLSVFSPLGLSLLGARLDEELQWQGPAGETHTARVAEIVYQPESSGDFNR
ncbi:GreA/GreB family elongation factor [Rubrivivax gelatinosus]|uniref:Nucleoside-diphosphate kinase n=1 Tax=Rubrivivax gelatinosus TaxID=28068 RepID=A0ABS1DPU9_RUBGE|nr:GreA/GreB family elongation factor [Rubrivivax gelatinosus]MBK1711595.1 nucleoside-diphosphate kinase [Rubrivivax gelatinosus]